MIENISQPEPITYGKASCLTVPESMVLPSEIQFPYTCTFHFSNEGSHRLKLLADHNSCVVHYIQSDKFRACGSAWEKLVIIILLA